MLSRILSPCPRAHWVWLARSPREPHRPGSSQAHASAAPHVSNYWGEKSSTCKTPRPVHFEWFGSYLVIFLGFFFFFLNATLWIRAAELKRKGDFLIFFFNFTVKKHISVFWLRQDEILATSQVSCAPLRHRALCSQHPVPEMKGFGACSLRGNVDFSSKTSVLVTGFINA